jgi:hypothetical protein
MLGGVGETEIEGPELAAVELNAAIWRAALRLDVAEEESEWDFKCECGASDCTAMVSVTLAEFDRLHAAEELILADGHTVTRAEKARRRAKQLRDEAAALVEQAGQQHERARRNIRAGR